MKHLEKISKYESYKLWIFSKIEYLIKNNKLSAKKLSLISNKFIKQCKRYIESYREKNFCYEHGNKNKISKKAICENIKKEIVDLYINIQEKINSSSDNTNYRMPHKLFYNPSVAILEKLVFGLSFKSLDNNYFISHNLSGNNIVSWFNIWGQLWTALES